MAIIKLSGIEKRKVSIFIVCFFCAVIAWLFFALSNQTVKTYKRTLIYTNLPLNKAFYPLQPDSVFVQVESSGWQAIFIGWGINKKPLAIDLSLLHNKNYIVFSQNLVSLNYNSKTGQKIKSIKPDTLFFDFTKRKVKKLPIKFISTLEFKKQFAQNGPIEINPKYVTVIGPEAELKKMQFWPTQVLKKRKIAATVLQNLSLVKTQKNNLNVFPLVVTVKIPVEEFTEKEIEIPIKVANNPNYYGIKLFPNKVAIKLMLPLSKFNKVTADDFEAIADLDVGLLNKAEKLPIKIINKVNFTQIVQIYPHQVAYIIKK
ncbi:MAG: YbbR-like domain-containing protein [Sphingobacteriales bacterium]|nr:MAG: YbbR-like domain-containing protein [Sphingobacteriales bacterium]